MVVGGEVEGSIELRSAATEVLVVRLHAECLAVVVNEYKKK